MSWLCAASIFILGADLAWPLQSAIVLAMSGVTGRMLWSYVLLRGPRAVRSLEWMPDEGLYYVCLGPQRRRLPAVPADCQRYGRALWLLRFQTGEGRVQLLVDPGMQEPKALRRLARSLFASQGARKARDADRSGRSGAAS